VDDGTAAFIFGIFMFVILVVALVLLWIQNRPDVSEDAVENEDGELRSDASPTGTGLVSGSGGGGVKAAMLACLPRRRRR
jgi:hypothetical protein